MASAATLSLIFKGDTSHLDGAVGSLSGKMGGISKGLIGGAALGVGALVGLGGAAVKAGMDFDVAMAEFQAVSGETAASMEPIRAKAMQIGKDTSFSAQEAALALGELSKAGVGTADILGGAADAAVALAAAGGVDMPIAAEIASAAMNNFSLSAKELPGVADLIAGAANASAISVEDFGMSLKASGAAAALAGVTFPDLATSITAMGNAGIKGSDAGTSLKTMLMNLTPTTKAQIAVFRELGLRTDDMSSAFYDSSGKMKPMGEVAGILQTSLKGLSEEQKMVALETMFGSDAIRAAAVIAKEGSAGFEELATSMGEISAADVAKTKLDTLSGSMDAMKGSIETAMISVGTKMAPGLKAGVDGAIAEFNKMMPAIEEFGVKVGEKLASIDWAAVGETVKGVFSKIGEVISWLSDHPGLVKIVLAVGGLVAVFAPVMAVIGPLIPIFGAIASVVGVVAGAMAAGTPIIAGLAAAFPAIAAVATALAGVLTFPLIAVIGLVVAAFLIWKAKGDEIKAALSAMVDSIKAKWDEFKAKTAELSAAVQAKIDELRQGVSDKIEAMKAAVTEKVEALKAAASEKFEAMKQAVSETVDALKAAVEEKIEALKAAMSAKWDEIKATIKEKWDSFKQVIADAWEAIKGAVEVGIRLIKSFIEMELNGIKRIFEIAFDIAATVREKIALVVDAVRTKVGEIAAAIQTAASDILAKAQQIGSDIIDGFKAGFQKGWDTLKAFLTGLFGNIIDLAKKILGIGSQSRVFRLMGEQSGDGYLLGLKNTLTSGAVGAIIAAAIPGLPVIRPGDRNGRIGDAASGGGLRDLLGGERNPLFDRFRTDLGQEPERKQGRLNQGSRGGFVAASGENFWKVWMAKNGGEIPDEQWARSTGMPIPGWLEAMWHPKIEEVKDLGGIRRGSRVGRPANPGGSFYPVKPGPHPPGGMPSAAEIGRAVADALKTVALIVQIDGQSLRAKNSTGDTLAFGGAT